MQAYYPSDADVISRLRLPSYLTAAIDGHAARNVTNGNLITLLHTRQQLVIKLFQRCPRIHLLRPNLIVLFPTHRVGKYC